MIIFPGKYIDDFATTVDDKDTMPPTVLPYLSFEDSSHEYIPNDEDTEESEEEVTSSEEELREDPPTI
ncbi:24589_t:CDS:2 [Gigaspora rosea]|nr:24589_t:CDS:2 [Gigaspora rosea]